MYIFEVQQEYNSFWNKLKNYSIYRKSYNPIMRIIKKYIRRKKNEETTFVICIGSNYAFRLS